MKGNSGYEIERQFLGNISVEKLLTRIVSNRLVKEREDRERPCTETVEKSM